MLLSKWTLRTFLASWPWPITNLQGCRGKVLVRPTQIIWNLQFSACFSQHLGAQLAFPLSEQDTTRYHTTSVYHARRRLSSYPCIWRVVKVEPINEERVRWADRRQIWSHHKPTYNLGERGQMFIIFSVFQPQKSLIFVVFQLTDRVGGLCV